MFQSTKQNITALETNRLKICRADENIGGLEPIFADEKTMKFYPDFVLSPERPLVQFLELLESHGVFIFPFAEKEGGGIVGFVTLNNVEEAAKQIEIGYFLLSSHWGRGYAREIVAGLIDYLKTQGWQRIMASIYSGNTASEKLLDDCGFVLEGVNKDKHVINGVKHDDRIYCLIT